MSNSKSDTLEYKKLRTVSFLMMSAAMASLTAPAIAQQASSQPTAQIEEVVVTARRRAENVQDVPVAVTAFQGRQLETRDISDISQLGNLAPNVTLKPTASLSGASNAAAFFVRGIGQTDFAVTTDPGVGVYVDGVYLARSIGGVLDTLDVESIEVLRGPQGTLFGRNTIGGALNIRTRRPADEFSLDAHVTVGSRSRRDFTGAMDLPLTDSLKARVSFLSRDQQGFVRRLVGLDNGGNLRPTDDKSNARVLSDRQGNKDTDTFRLTLEYQATDAVNFLLTADTTTVNEESVASTAAISSAGLIPASALGPIEVPGLGLVSPGDPRFITDDIDTTFATGPNGTLLDIWGLALTTTVDFSMAEFKSITSYRSTKGEFNRDGDGTPFPIGEQTRDIDYEQFSQEIQLNGSSFSDRLAWTVGAYFFDEQATDNVFISLGNLFGPPPSIDIDNLVDNQSLAVFGQGTFELTERLSVTGGLRWIRDRKSYDTSQVIPVIPLTVVDEESTETFKDITGRLGIEYKINDDHLLYVSAAKGFKSGGFTPRYVAPVAAPLPFDPETVWSYEVGSKWKGLNNRASLNAAAFYSRYKDIQLVLFDSFGAPINQNGGDATIWGVEAEGVFILHEYFRISATAGYIDAGFDSVLPPNASIPFQPVTVDSRFANTPEFQSSVSPEATFPLSGGFQLNLRADWLYSSSVHQTFENDPELFQPSYHLFEASATIEHEKHDWGLTLGVHNLTDKRIIISGGIGRVPGFGDVNYNAPREWYLTLRKGF